MYKKKPSRKRKHKEDLRFYITRCEDGMSFEINMVVKVNHYTMYLNEPTLYTVCVRADEPTGNTIILKKKVEEKSIKLVDGIQYPKTIKKHYCENGLCIDIVLRKKFYMSRKMNEFEREFKKVLRYLNDEDYGTSPSSDSMLTIYVVNNVHRPFRG